MQPHDHLTTAAVGGRCPQGLDTRVELAQGGGNLIGQIEDPRS